MGEVIQGPWKPAEIPDLMRTLDDELVRMINALEKLRELHRRGEPFDQQALPDVRREQLTPASPSLPPRMTSKTVTKDQV